MELLIGRGADDSTENNLGYATRRGAALCYDTHARTHEPEARLHAARKTPFLLESNLNGSAQSKRHMAGPRRAHRCSTRRRKTSRQVAELHSGKPVAEYDAAVAKGKLARAEANLRRMWPCMTEEQIHAVFH